MDRAHRSHHQRAKLLRAVTQSGAGVAVWITRWGGSTNILGSQLDLDRANHMALGTALDPLAFVHCQVSRQAFAESNG